MASQCPMDISCDYSSSSSSSDDKDYDDYDENELCNNPWDLDPERVENKTEETPKSESLDAVREKENPRIGSTECIPLPEDSLGESSVPAGQGSRERLLVDIGQLANILTQARGPILARITQLLATRFGGSGRLSGSGSVDVTEWVECLEGMCQLENVSPADIIGYVLEGNASRIYGRMMVGDASQWAVVKAALLGEYALPRGEAHRRFIGRRLEADEPVDVYVDSLERLGGRLGLASDCAFFRTHFYEGLPASVNKWAVMREDAYTASFETVGWLREWRGPIEGFIPLLAVFQPSKDKVRPVMDYRELNDFVECHTGDVIAVCGEKIREWRQLRGELKIVDLKSAYLQIHISENLWKYQVVKYKGVAYALTRLGFGLSCAPRIMTAILGKVLSMDERVRRGTDHYIDDIVVRESVLSAQELREHLARYGLESKAPEGLDGGRVLGISLRKGSGGHLEMSRGMVLSEIVMDQSRLTKRGLFSLCGRLVGHYPVAGWLRPCCSFLKRLGCGGSWDEPVESSVGELANELLVRARAEDPVRGRWHVSPHGTVTVWTDASSLGMGVALEVDGSVAEDASWLRKESDHRHINVAELEAVARGINLAISWGFKTFTVATDSRTVISWMDNTVEGHRRVRTKGASEMLIKRRLGVIRDTITEFGLTVTVRFVSTTENKADRMTRVPKKWLGHRYTGEEGADVSAALATGESVEDAIWAAHLPHHLGVDRTLYLARQIRRNLTREQVKRELVGCEACQRIDPARREENLVAQGSLAVDGNWRRVAVDVTHYGANHYLSMVDCGPSRFAIWRRLSSAHVVHCGQMEKELECVCCQEQDKVKNKSGDKCITEHSGFYSVCLNPDALDTAWYGYVQHYPETL
ncbi:hypothetical protein GQR58_002379 [Nymphon striatum]|nr:hypothetical protein GQR58_002379 [Nymphon striatum]